MSESNLGAVNAAIPAVELQRRVPSDRKRAGQLLAQGNPAGRVAELVGVDSRTIERWKEDDEDFRSGYFEEERRLNAVAEVCRVKIMLELPDIVEQQIAVAKDINHKEFGPMSRYLVDKVLIPQSIQHTNNHHEVDVTFWRALDERLSKLVPSADRGNGHIPELLAGEAAAESYGARSLKDATDELLDVNPSGEA